MKTHAEFLEELKKFLDEEIARDKNHFYEQAIGRYIANEKVLEKIEQFEAEKKQVKY